MLESSLPIPCFPKRGGSGNPVSDGPATPINSLSAGTFNARRLWQRDDSVHDGFRMLTDILDAAHVGVLCIQEVFTGDFPSLPVDQAFTYDGPVGSLGREAAFLIHAGFSGVPISGVEDRTCARWRAFSGSWCICSYYAPHAGIPHDERVRFWRDFVVTARRSRHYGPAYDHCR